VGPCDGPTTGLGFIFWSGPAAAALQGLASLVGHLEASLPRGGFGTGGSRRPAETGLISGDRWRRQSLARPSETFLVTAAWPRRGRLDIAAMCLQTGIRTGFEDLSALRAADREGFSAGAPEARSDVHRDMVWNRQPDTALARQVRYRRRRNCVTSGREREGGSGDGLVLLAALMQRAGMAPLSLWP